MNNRIKSTINSLQNSLALQFRISILYLKNLFTLKSLKFKSILTTDSFIIEGTEFDLFWNVRGCHKIKIKNTIVIPGDVSGVKFLFRVGINPIVITFYGIGKQLKKIVTIKGKKIEVLNDFESTINLPQIDPRTRQTVRNYYKIS